MTPRFTLSYANVKGRTSTHLFGPVNVVVGENFAGKSTVLTALRLALLGYDPALGKTNQATWKLASDEKMTVELSGQSQCLKRSWQADLNGSVKATRPEYSVCDVPFALMPTNVVLNIPELLIDVRSFFAKSARERAAYILGLVPISEASVSEASIKEAIGEMDEHVREFVEFWIGDRQERGTPAGQWLTEMLASADVQAKDEAAKAREADATVRRMLDAGSPAEVPRDVSGEIEVAEEELRRLSVLAETCKTAARRAQDRAQAVLAVQTAVDRLETAKAALNGVQAFAGITKKQADKAQSDNEKASADMLTLDKERGIVAGQIKKLDVTGKCPTCGCKPSAKLKGQLGKRLLKVKADMEAAKAVATSTSDVLQSYQMFHACSSDVACAESVLADARERLEGVPEVDPVRDVTPLEIQAARMKITDLKATQGRFTQHGLRQTILANAETDAAASRSDAERWTAVTKALVKVRDDAVAAAFDGFAAKVRRFTDGILPWDLKVKDGEIGYYKSGLWVGHEVFSGSEMAMVYAGLGVALAESAPVKIVMMDEVLLSDDTKSKLAKRMLELATAGVIDAFVCVDVRKAGWLEDVVNFVEVQ